MKIYQIMRYKKQLIYNNKNILISNYNGVLILPGGKLDKDETNAEALIRELKEEIGQEYNKEELNYFMTLKHYQKNYPRMENYLVNRIVQASYFVGTYKEINNNLQQLSDREKKGKFKLELELISLDELETIVLNNINDNLRNIYFQEELLEVLSKFMNKE